MPTMKAGLYSGRTTIAVRTLIGLAAIAGLATPAAAQNSRPPIPVPNNVSKPKPAEATKPAEQPKDTPAAQPGKNTPADTAKPGKTISGVLMDATPLHLDTLGITLLVPEGSKAESSAGGGQAQVRITPADSSWIITLRNLRTNSSQATTAEVMELVLSQIKASVGSDPKLAPKELSRTNTLEINKKPAERVYMTLPAKEAGKVPFAQGVTIFALGPGNFAVFEVLCGERDLDKARQVYEVVVGAAAFDDLSEMSQKRMALVAAGTSLMSQVTNEDLDAIVKQFPERWERLSKPAQSGSDADAKEVAYRRMRCVKGKRSDLPKFREQKLANDEGYIFYLDVRFLRDQTSAEAQSLDPRLSKERDIVDVQSVFFVTLDRKEELWSVRTALRRAGKVAVYDELGVRVGNDMNVQISIDDGTKRSVKPFIQGAGYISRVEAYLMPQILIRKKILTEFGFYTYQSDTEKVNLRRDTLAQVEGATNLYTLSTRLTEDGLYQNSTFKDTGELVKTELADGTLWEPTDLAKLKKLWSSKRLPMD